MGFFRKEKSKKPDKVRKTLMVTRALLFMMSFAPAVANSPVVDRLAGVETAYASEATFSNYWFQDTDGSWKVRDNTGQIVKNAWLCDDAIQSNGQDVWYLLDSNGNMITNGLVQDATGNIYSLEINHNGYFGMLRYKSGNYDGVYLDLESSHAGGFAKIKNQDGISALQAKCNLRQVSISNENCVYTSMFKVDTGSSTGGADGSGGGYTLPLE